MTSRNWNKRTEENKSRDLNSHVIYQVIRDLKSVLKPSKLPIMTSIERKINNVTHDFNSSVFPRFVFIW